MNHETLHQSPRYLGFIAERDRALEKIHQNTQIDLSRILFEGFDQIEKHVAKLVTENPVNVYAMNQLTGSLEGFVASTFGALYPKLLKQILRMRRAVFTLTYASEIEAIGRATQKKLGQPEFSKKLGQAIASQTILNQKLENRIWLSLMKLKGRITDAFSLALVQELTPREILLKVKDSLPEIESYKVPRRELKPFREADTPRGKRIFQDSSFIDGDDWDLVQQSYQNTELPPSRFDNSPEIDRDAGYYKYNWELEQDLTDDFVKQVRDGQINAANDLGIQEFVWVALIDQKTDECCLKRNGHTTSEIEDMLNQGKLDEDVCDSSSPPAHPNCRCQLSPVASTNEVQGPDWSSFQDWLEAA